MVPTAGVAVDINNDPFGWPAIVRNVACAPLTSIKWQAAAADTQGAAPAQVDVNVNGPMGSATISFKRPTEPGRWRNACQSRHQHLVYKPNKVRFVTASLFDGHDASINIMRRILRARLRGDPPRPQPQREEVVDAALQEDAHGIALSSYQGGHVEYFKVHDRHAARGGRRPHQGIRRRRRRDRAGRDQDLHAYGVARIFSPEDGASGSGLQGMINDMIAACDQNLAEKPLALDAEIRRPQRPRPLDHHARAGRVDAAR